VSCHLGASANLFPIMGYLFAVSFFGDSQQAVPR
jgi:hypothetical protein